MNRSMVQRQFSSNGMSMPQFDDLLNSENRRRERHIPVIHCPEKFREGDLIDVRVTIEKDLVFSDAEHSIRWITLYFFPEGEKVSLEVGQFMLDGGKESGTVLRKGQSGRHHEITTSVKVTKPGTFYATSYCNVHGLSVSSSKFVKIV